MNVINKKITLALISILILFGLKTDLNAQRLDISGTVSYYRVGNHVTLNAARIDHYINPLYYQSGTLYLQLWTCLTPFNGLQTSLGYKVAEATLDPLFEGYFYQNVSQTVPFVAPPDGTYYMVMVLAESDGYQRLTVDWHNFPNTDTFGYVPPPPPVVISPSITSHPASLNVIAGASATFSVSTNGTSPSYQWYKSGSPISGATASSYSIQSALASDAGNYTVTVFNSAGSVSSNAATLTVTPPPPTLSITSQPIVTQILNAGSAATLSVLASGTALTYQWYEGARGDTSIPVGGNSSSLTTPPLSNNTSFWVRISNADGFVDSTASAIIVWPQGIRVGDQFAVNLSPLAAGGKTLKLVGKLPAGLSLNTITSQILGTVTGNAGNFTPSIQVIQNNAVLQTISIPISVGNFPISLLGNYEALLKDQNGAPFGVFKLTTGKNVWTASLETLGQARRTAKGVFALQQGSSSASLEVKFAATKTAPALTLNFTLDGDSPFLFGNHNTGILEGFKMIDSLTSATNPIHYNLIIDQGTVNALDKPAGKGWASGSFARTGIGTFKGMLGDATACSFSLRLSVTGQAILWAQPYANKNSYIGGVVDLVEMVPNADNYEALEPRVSWVKVADAKTLSYPNGFSFDALSVSSSRWIVPATHTALGDSLGWLGGEKCTVRIHGAGLSKESQQSAVSVEFPTEFTLDKAFKLIAPINASIIKWSGSAVKGTGAFSGSFALPSGFAANTIAGSGAVSGLLLQDDKWGITTGLGLMKVPISGAKGSFRTAAVALEQYEANTAPAITSVADQLTTIGNSTTAIPFTIDDIHTTASSLTLSASSSNTTLVPNANIVFGGSGANRTVTVTPVSGQSGTVTITVTVSDGWHTTSDTFLLTVSANSAPSISEIDDQFVNTNDSITAIPFTISDIHTTASSLTLSGSSSDTNLVPDANIVLGGSGANRTVTVTPASGQSGTVTITVTVSDGSLSSIVTFTLIVNSAPTISDIVAQSIDTGRDTGALAFTIGDTQTAASSLTLNASSSNTTLVPNANIVFGGSGANRTVTVTPASGQVGTATITITVSDGSLSTSDTFVVTVTGMVDLGVMLPSHTNSYASGVSADGTVVVGYSWNWDNGEYRAFRWTAAEGMVDLGVLPGYTNFTAHDVSADGSVVVGDAFNNGNNRRVAFRWTAAEGMVDLGTLPGDDIPYSSYYAAGVSADGSVVVGEAYDEDTGENRRAFRWTAAEGMIDLGILPINTDHTNTFANGVSDDGNVVVGNSGVRAFRWTAEGGMVDLGVLPGYNNPSEWPITRAVSADGNVVVGVYGNRAFRWTETKGMVDLDAPPSHFFPQPSGVSANGSVIVGGRTAKNDYNTFSRRVAFRWTAAEGMVDLGTLPGDDIPYSSYEASGVSADGNVVVGTITSYGPTQYRAFRWFGPTPATPH